jgi:YbbR domain-containing protein
VSAETTRKSKLKAFVGCLLAATFFWLMNALNKDTYSLRLDYPIHFNYDESRYVPVQPLPSQVSVNVSGDGWNLLRKSWLTFAERPVEYTIKNPLNASILNTTSLQAQIAEQFPNLRVNHVVSDTFELDFERKATRIIPVRVDSLHLDMRPGFVISSLINVSPSLISIEGPVSIIRHYPDTLFVKVPARKIQNNYDETLPLTFPAIPLVEVSHTSVFVSFEVARLLRPLPQSR